MACVIAGMPARAALGGDVASVERDRSLVGGVSHTVTQMQSYDRHEIVTADGLQLHEFADRSGHVFAVTWQGHAQPDLTTLLGNHYSEYVSAARTPRPGGHHVFMAQSGDLVIRIIRLPRGFIGGAHVPSLMPAGVSAQELQ